METKKCSRCKAALPLTEFSPNREAPDGLRYVCKACDSDAHRLLYQKDPRKFIERGKINKQRAKDNNLCRSCYKPLDGTARTLCNVCAQKNRDWTSARRNRLKDACFAAYGGYRCACCGETEKSFLQIDHINGGGNKQRRAEFGCSQPGSAKVYGFLVKAGFPTGYQVLCANCNIGKCRTGTCPHEQKPQHPIDAMLSHYKNEGTVN